MSYSGLKEAISELRLRNCVIVLKHNSGLFSCKLATEKDLYEAYWLNERVSKEIRFVLSQFEVILRNKLNEAFIGHYGPGWLTSGFLKFGAEEERSINDAIRRLTILRKTPTHERILAKLSLSFWVRLFRAPYRHATERLKDDIFPRNKTRFGNQIMSYQDILNTLAGLRDLRNKVSHQEFVLDSRYEIVKRHKECIELIKRMSKDYYSLFQSNDNFLVEFNHFRSFLTPILALPEMNGFRW
jgi:hypothetical protein